MHPVASVRREVADGLQNLSNRKTQFQHIPYALCDGELTEHRSEDGNANANRGQVSHGKIQRNQMFEKQVRDNVKDGQGGRTEAIAAVKQNP